MKVTHSRWFFNLKTIVKLAVGNKLRFILTLVGVGISVFIIELGFLLVDGYYNGCLSEANEMPRNTIFTFFQGSEYEVTKADRLALAEKLYEYNMKTVRSEYFRTFLKADRMANGGMYNIYGSFQAVSKMDSSSIYYSDLTGAKLVTLNLLYGRYISHDEIANNEPVVVIDRYTSMLLFGKVNSVGEYITINDERDKSKPVACQVVGVVENNFYVSQQEMTNAEIINDSQYKNEYYGLTLCLYCPYRMFENVGYDESEVRLIANMWGTDEENYNKFKAKLMSTVEKIPCSGLTDYDIVLSDLEYRLQPVKDALKFVVLVLVLISAVACISVVAFSMKERTYEIGIKKAFGADSVTVFTEIMYENVVITAIASVVAIALAWMVGSWIQGYLAELLNIRIILKVNARLVLLPAIIGEILVFVFSSIPVLISTSISVVDAIRQE